MAFTAHTRPIEGAVATLGVSERVAFLRRTYAHLGIALVGWVALTAGLFSGATQVSLKFSSWAMQGSLNWLLVLGAFMLVGYATDRLARSETSRGVQYAGLFLGVAAQALILQPLLWVAFIRTGGSVGRLADGTFVVMSGSSGFGSLVGSAALVTAAIFVGLTLTVFVTKKDFSFMRGILMIGTFAALGVILASMLFGFQLGAVFAGALILLMAGYILYQTSLVAEHYPPTHHVSAALMLFSTIATLFWYVLQLLMELRR